MTDLLSKSLDFPPWVAEKSCAVCPNPSDAHHMVAVGSGGNRKKESLRHYSCINFCRLHHGLYHQHGLVWFEKKFNIEIWKHVASLILEFISGTPQPWFRDK